MAANKHLSESLVYKNVRPVNRDVNETRAFETETETIKNCLETARDRDRSWDFNIPACQGVRWYTAGHKDLLSMTAQHAVKRASFLLGVGAFRPCQNVDTIR